MTIDITDKATVFATVFGIYQSEDASPEVKKFISDLARQNPGIVPEDQKEAVDALTAQLVGDALDGWAADPATINLADFKRDVVQVLLPIMQAPEPSA